MSEIPPILVTFARPEESRAFRQRLREPERVRMEGGEILLGTRNGQRVAVAHTGIGPEAAARVGEVLLRGRKFERVIGAGFAGALAPGLAAGEVMVEAGDGAASRRLVSRALPVESVEEKAALHRETGAVAVDMETETLAAICAQRGVAFTAVRAISDTAEEALPVPFAVWFDVPRQCPRVWSLIGWLAVHPGRIGAFVRFVRRLGMVSERLADGIEAYARGR